MLHVNAEARYTAAQILSHPWVSVSKLHFTSLYLGVKPLNLTGTV